MVLTSQSIQTRGPSDHWRGGSVRAGVCEASRRIVGLGETLGIEGDVTELDWEIGIVGMNSGALAFMVLLYVFKRIREE